MNILASKDYVKMLLKNSDGKIKVSYKYEVYVLSVETNRKKIEVGNYEVYKEDMGDINVKYKPSFWNSLSVPPESAFYKKNVKELESIYGVPLEKLNLRQ